MSPDALVLVRPTPPGVRPPPTALPTRARRRRRLRRPREATTVLLVAAVTYLGLGVWLTLVNGVVLGDALARVANAYYVVASREPHLGAVGFVWNPLPSLALLPLVALRDLVPALLDHGFAANVVSALVMAGAVQQAHKTFQDAGLGRPLRLSLTGALACHPMLLLYGANGMSEAWLLLGLTWSTRRLVRWLTSHRPADLTGCAAGLAVAYLCRYEAIAAAAAVPVLVGGHTWAVVRGSPRLRRQSAVSDVLLVALPVTVCFVGWAALSWLIVGHPFETFTSPYGNSAQVDVAGAYIARDTGGGDLLGRARYVGEQVGWLAPGLALLALLVLPLGLRRRSAVLLAPVAVFGSVLAFQTAAFLHGDTFGWLRFSIAAVPLTALLAGLVAAQVRPRGVAVLAGPLAVALVAAGTASAWRPALDPQLGREEAAVLLPLLLPQRATAEDRATQARFDNERAVAAWLDEQRLPEGSVLLDTAPGFAVVLFSDHPEQFVINSDSDFAPALADPAVYGVRYVLAQPLQQHAVNSVYPGLYENGTASLTPVRTFAAGDVGYPWRVFAVEPLD